ncbi:hypothetical protein HDU98_002829 [Podochytrium sp. JEL0797]|nr:hypothetical protein HDU98_002829 [Podochytrium sp. JEL0797]
MPTSAMPITTADPAESFSGTVTLSATSAGASIDPDGGNAGFHLSSSTIIVGSIFGVGFLGAILGLYFFRRHNARKTRNEAFVRDNPYDLGGGFNRHEEDEAFVGRDSDIALAERQRIRDSVGLVQHGTFRS